jgi:hypothetical protein
MASLIRLYQRKPKEPSQNIVVPHHILLMKEEKTSVRSVMGVIRKRTILIDHRPLPPTLILANHIPIATFMGMLQIFVSHYTQNYDINNHKLPMMLKDKVLGRLKKEKCP